MGASGTILAGHAGTFAFGATTAPGTGALEDGDLPNWSEITYWEAEELRDMVELTPFKSRLKTFGPSGATFRFLLRGFLEKDHRPPGSGFHRNEITVSLRPDDAAGTREISGRAWVQSLKMQGGVGTLCRFEIVAFGSPSTDEYSKVWA